MCILDISKICLYEFHHECMVPQFGKTCKVMYTDTNSLIFHIMREDIYEIMRRDISRFHTNDYPIENKYNIPLVNKKVPGLMKDKNNGMIMTNFVGLGAKMYTLRIDGKSDTKKAKGVKTSVVRTTITFDEYMRCLQHEIAMSRTQTCIRSKLHKVYTISERKIAVSPYDDKRYIIPNSTETLPWAHYRIPSGSRFILSRHIVEKPRAHRVYVILVYKYTRILSRHIVEKPGAHRLYVILVYKYADSSNCGFDNF
ncbi:uncharacterized protein LOC143218198 [Lasioglossum baleicum]|uniref:uncharacterized protein LOC143218198 n=1 Tax=Lasioglossum baleicum TaxID=434251 RepID=UPI003FCCB4C6